MAGLIVLAGIARAAAPYVSALAAATVVGLNPADGTGRPHPVALCRWAPLAAMLVGVVMIALAGQPDTSGSLSRTAGPVVPFEPSRLVDYHSGYWVATMAVDGFPFPATIINDLHVDADTNRVTVYAQSRVRGRVVAAAQVGPGKCTENVGRTVCFQPDAVYLNRSGQESMEADGTGAW